MIEKKVEELFLAIRESFEYQNYVSICHEIDNNELMCKIIRIIKLLEQEAVRLENRGNILYLEFDYLVDVMNKKLNSFFLYREYLVSLEKLNELLCECSFHIEEYINHKV